MGLHGLLFLVLTLGKYRNQQVFQGKCVLHKHEFVKAMVYEVQNINDKDLSNQTPH